MDRDDTLRITLDCVRTDYDDEIERTSAIDTKLTNVAAFAGVSLAIGGSLGGNVLTSGKIDDGFEIHIAVSLGLAVAFLTTAILVCFRGLWPAPFRGIELDAAKDRIRPDRLASEDAVEMLASTYATSLLPSARGENNRKAKTAKWAYVFVQLGFTALAVSLVLTVIGATV